MTEVEVAGLLAFLAECYPTTPPSAHPQARVKVWHSLLGGYDGTAVMIAAHEVARHEKFHPTVAHIVEEVDPGPKAKALRMWRQQRQRGLPA